MNSKIVVFIPSIEGGGVEKNLFLICNYLSRKVDKLKVITISGTAGPVIRNNGTNKNI